MQTFFAVTAGSIDLFRADNWASLQRPNLEAPSLSIRPGSRARMQLTSVETPRKGGVDHNNAYQAPRTEISVREGLALRRVRTGGTRTTAPRFAIAATSGRSSG